MRMKKKIRRAFDSATPNVLNKVLLECPETHKPQVMTVTPAVKRPHRVREILSTAAALILLIGVAAFGIWFLKNPDGLYASHGTVPTETQNPAPSTGPDFQTNVDFIALIRNAWAIVDPEESNNEGVNTSYLTDQNGASIFHLEISSRGYCYGFDYDAVTGQLKNLEVIMCDCIKEGYISPGVAAQTALLDVAGVNSNVEWTVLEPELNEAIRCYIITMSHPILAYSEIRYVDCVTGQFVEDLDSLSTLFNTPGSWYNMALTCSYTSPTELSLAQFFYNGFSDESRTPTEDELALLDEAAPDMDLIRLPVEKMNKVLTQYFGITLDDMDGSCFEGLTYLERTNCYYMIHNDALYVEGFTIVGRTVTNNSDIIAVQYTIDGSEDVHQLVVTPLYVSYYQIISNHIPGQELPPDGNIGPELAISTALEYMNFAEEDVADLTCEFDGEQYYIVTFTANLKRHIITVGAFNPNVEAYYFEYLADPISYDDARMDVSDYLPQEEYFSEDRQHLKYKSYQSSNSWIKSDGQNHYLFRADLTKDGIVVQSSFLAGSYIVPGTSSLYGSYSIEAANGICAYVYSESSLLEVDLETGNTVDLCQGQQLLGIVQCDSLVLYYGLYDSQTQTLSIRRYYTPTGDTVTLYQYQGAVSNFSLNSVKSTHSPVTFQMMNPEFIQRLMKEFKDPDSPFQTLEQYDYSYIWEAEDPLAEIGTEYILLHHIQEQTGIRMFIQGSVDPVTGAYQEKTGIIDGCWYGSGYSHDHFNPEITTSDEPVVILGAWQNSVETPDFQLVPEGTDSESSFADGYALIPDKYCNGILYGVNNGFYTEIADLPPILDAADTGESVIALTTDGRILAISKDGTGSAELYRARNGCLEKLNMDASGQRICFLDGDTLIVFDLLQLQYRELVSHVNITSMNYDPEYGEDWTLIPSEHIYFEVTEGLWFEGYVIDINTGALDPGYRL